ncbi:unnamed protein product [Phytophthora fragariaefolia]|uniref:Unnamed protein product n=1 Tax=Phytophthora fragariaefolia TaxID=1490495 RepID=A0A9W6XMV5_9STRA|nr:unnamed protein product [Phytophthora fragariaefolia]
MPVAALNAEELAEQVAIAESELDDNRDEDYDESAEAKSNDDAEYLEATTPPATPRNADFGTGSALTSPAGTPLQLAQQTAACSPTPTPHRTSTARSLDMESSTSTHADPPTTSAPHDVEATEDEYALNSEYEDSDPGSAEWYEEMGELLPPGGTAVDSDSECDSGDEYAETATPPASKSLASSRAASPEASPKFQTSASVVPPSATARRAATAQKKQERERWKAVIDNWLELEGQDWTKLANDTKALKKMRKDGWETGWKSISGKNEQQASSGPTPADDNAGPAATLRNMNAVLPPKQDGVYYAVVTDRFYTSIQSGLQLLRRNVYSVGTIQTNKKGFPPALVLEKSKRPKNIPHGTTKIVVAKSVPQMSAMVWFDNTIVSATPPYPRSIGNDPVSVSNEGVQPLEGGVDVHDQLRLQRYSLQMSLRFRKYYKSLALGLIDIAIVNSFIVYREACKMRGEPPVDHADFITQLHAQLLAIGPTEFADMVSSTLESFSSSSNRLCLDVFARPGHTDM